MISKKIRNTLIIALILRVILSVQIYSGDLNNHFQWGKGILRLGFSGAYDRDYPGVMRPTYPPLALFAFITSTGLYELTYNTAATLNKTISIFPSKLIWALEDQDVLPAFNKVIAIVSDIGVGLLIYRLSKSYLAMVFYVFNPAVWYISSWWGQIESFPVFFVLLGLWMLKKQKLLGSQAAFAASLLAKQTALIFVPITTYLTFRQFGLKKTLFGLLLQAVLGLAIYAPFTSNQGLFGGATVYLDRLQNGSGSVWITDHAFNPWIWVSYLQKIPDDKVLFDMITARSMGLLVFGSVLTALGIKFISLKNPSLSAGLFMAAVSAAAFLSLTKMHERYFAPVLPFLALHIKNKWLRLIYVAASIAHLGNLYHEWYFPGNKMIESWIVTWPAISLLATTLTISGGMIILWCFKSSSSRQ